MKNTAIQNPILQIENLCAELPANEKFLNVSFKLYPGEFVALLSRSSYNLENLADILNGRKDYTFGTISMQGRIISVNKIREHIIPVIIRPSSLIPFFSIAQNMFLHVNCTKKKAEKLAQEQLDSFGVNIDLSKSIEELTNSELRLVEILREYNSDTNIIIMYDSAININKHHAPPLRNIFEKICNEGKGILYLTTNIEDALYYSDKIFLLGNGVILEEYVTESIKQNPRDLIHLMSGMNYGYLENQEKNMILESIIRTRDIVTSNVQLKDTLTQLAGNIASIMSAQKCTIYIRNIQDSSSMDMFGCLDDTSNLFKSYLINNDLIFEKNQKLNINLLEEISIEKESVETPIAIVNSIDNSNQLDAYIALFYKKEPIIKEDEELYLTAFLKEISMAIEMSRLSGYSVLLQEIHHRIKNNLQMMVNLMYMQRAILANNQNKEFTPIMNEIINRIKSIALVHELLSVDEINNSSVDIKEIINKIILFYAVKGVEIEQNVESITIPYNKATSMALIVNELLNNCLKHAFTDGMQNKKIMVISKRNKHNIKMIVKDNGIGLPDSIKQTRNAGLGTKIIRAIVESFDGSIKYKSDNGTLVKLKFPLSKMFEM